MNALQTLDVSTWTGPFADEVRADAIAALEGGQVLYFPQLPFVLRDEEKPLLTKSKGKIFGATLPGPIWRDFMDAASVYS